MEDNLSIKRCYIQKVPNRKQSQQSLPGKLPVAKTTYVENMQIQIHQQQQFG